MVTTDATDLEQSRENDSVQLSADPSLSLTVANRAMVGQTVSQTAIKDHLPSYIVPQWLQIQGGEESLLNLPGAIIMFPFLL